MQKKEGFNTRGKQIQTPAVESGNRTGDISPLRAPDTI